MTEARVCRSGGGFGRKQIAFLFIVLQALALGVAGSSFSLARVEDDDGPRSHEGYMLAVEGVMRHLLQAADDGMVDMNGSFILAANRTARRDPTDNFNTYRGGWDIQNDHYWASVGYTGLPAFVVAVVWAGLGLLGLLFLLCCCCFCGSRTKPEYDHGKCGYIIPIILLVFFTAVAIAGCVILYYGQAKFNDHLEDTLDFIVRQSNTTEEGLRRVSRNLTRASEINIENLFTLSDADKAEIVNLNTQLNNSANTLERDTADNARDIKHYINIVRISLMVVAAVMLFLVILGLLFAACGIRSIVYLLVFLGWILVTGTWILCGIFILLNNTLGDTCVAMGEWVERPSANTTLDQILPCADPATANLALDNSRDYTDKIITLANDGITTVANGNFPPGTPTYYNQTGPLVPILCDLYGPAPDFDLLPCTPGQLSFEAAPANWSSYVCVTNSSGICQTQGRLTNSTYRQLTTATDVGQSLFTDANFLVSVANCSFVRDTFTEIRDVYCHDLRKYCKWIWVGLILVSGGAMLSILLWMVYIRRKRYRYAPGKVRYAKDPPVYNGLGTAPPSTA
ncbi:hypothetical protein Mapa_017229 [Marchantia paleacea]|nr:hypothetical protein Mapa_017229 [Marchantia paleacea]